MCVQTKLYNDIGHSLNHLQKGKLKKTWMLPVSVDLTVPRLLLHTEKCTDLHNAGETGVQKDREQQRGRNELPCWSIRSQCWVGMSWTHWKTNAFFPITISLLTIKDWDAYYLETCVRIRIRQTWTRGLHLVKHIALVYIQHYQPLPLPYFRFTRRNEK